MLTLGGGLFLWVATAIFINSHGALITCEAGTYVLGQPASVTCNFRTNVSASKSSFNIAHYSSDAQRGDIGTDILVCHWSKVSQKHDCTVTEGYNFKNINEQYVTVGIPNATDEYAGIYTCFFVPSQGKDIHACELFVRKTTLNDTTPIPQEGEDDTPTTAVAVALSLILLVLIIFALLCIYRIRRKDKTGQKKDDESADPLLGHPPKTKKQIQELLGGFELPKKNLEALMKTSKKPSKLMNILEREIKQGLDNITRSEEDNTTPSVGDDITQSDAALQMNRLYCPLLDQADNSNLLVVDLGFTIVKISFVRLREKYVFTTSNSYMVKAGTGNQMFVFIAESIKHFVCDNGLTGCISLHAAIIYPFPCHQTSLKKARLAKCTREFPCEDIVNKDIQELLQNALQRIQTPCKVKLVAIVNNAVSTLVSVAHKTPDCKIGLTVGTGFNVCFVEQWRRVDTSGTEQTQSEGMVYNTEFGALGDNGCLAEYRTDFDRDLDDLSSKPGSQIFDKMVSWTYIGDIVRLALKKLRQENVLLPSEEQGCKLFQLDSVTSDRVAMIASDTESPYQKTTDILAELEVTQYTDKDLHTIRYVCFLVCERATYLTAAALATLINHLDQPGVMIVVDGELNKKLPCFGERLYSITNGLVKPHLTDKFHLVSSAGLRNVGAALIATASMHQN